MTRSRRRLAFAVKAVPRIARARRINLAYRHLAITMLSSPIGFWQQVAAELVSLIERVSITSVGFELSTLLKFPKVLGSVSVSANTCVAFLRPVIVKGIGLVLEYRSTDLKVNADPPAVT